MNAEKLVEGLAQAEEAIREGTAQDTREVAITKTKIQEAQLFASLIPEVQSVQGFGYARDKEATPAQQLQEPQGGGSTQQNPNQ